MIGKGGLGTPHMDGNTRLCTATAAQSLKESFGSDGQPASYTDVDHADTFFLIGHNVAACQTVLWSRMLDRRRGPDPPALVVVDPWPTPTARDADLLDTVERSRDEVVAQLKWLRTRMKQAAPQALVVAD